jgi:hypothetical protein
MTPALTANRSSSNSNRSTGLVWTNPERGFDDWYLREDLDATDRLLAELERESTAEQRVRRSDAGNTATDAQSLAGVAREASSGQSSRPLPIGVVRVLWPLGIAALLVGAGLVLGSFAAECGELWDGGLAVMVIGQAALLLASLADRKKP